MKPMLYICKTCGKMVQVLKDSPVPVKCCGQDMELMVPNTEEGSGEKHLPVVSLEEGVVHVKVGAVEHPMLPAHSIQWVLVVTEEGEYRKPLEPGKTPEVQIHVGEEKVVAVYEYCNIHGLWMTEL